MTNSAQLLHYGYLPDQTPGLPPAVNSAADKSVDFNGCDLVKLASDTFDVAISKCLENTSSGITHVIPLSSGLDSRLILGAVCERVPQESILTITYGTPGTWDYELGQKVAQEAGVENIAVDLRYDIDWSYESINESVSSVDNPSRLLAIHSNQKLSTFVKPDDWILWSGFLGEASAGQHLPKKEAESWEDACNAFATWNQWTSLAPNNYNPIKSLPNKPYVPRKELGYRDQLDFAVRQEMFIRPIIDQFELNTPYETTDWLDFSLNLPLKNRQKRSLFKKLAVKKYPDLFQIGSDATFGQPLTASTVRQEASHYFHGALYRIANKIGVKYQHPNMQYLDYKSALRHSALLRDTAYRYCDELDTANVFDTNIGHNIFKQHQRSKNLATEIRAIMTTAAFYDQ